MDLNVGIYSEGASEYDNTRIEYKSLKISE